jgi:D-alanyl-D-alanine carboxypeptidase
MLIFVTVAGLVSCSTENQQVHKYSKLKLNNAEITRDLKGSYSNSLLSTDLCIVDKTFPNTVDDVITSDGALLINITKKECAFSKNLYTRMYPASITKFLTALVALKKCNITDEVTINGEETKIYESGAKLCGFKESDKISMENLISFVRHDNFSQISTTKLNFNNRIAAKRRKETFRGMAYISNSI